MRSQRLYYLLRVQINAISDLHSNTLLLQLLGEYIDFVLDTSKWNSVLREPCC